MAGGEDQDIFEAGETPDVAAPETPLDDSQAVKDGIREMQREGPSRDRERSPPPQPQPQHGADAQSPGGILRDLLDERDRRQGLERQLQRYQEQEREAQRRAKENEVPFEQRFFSEPQKELQAYLDQRTQPIEMRVQNLAADFDMRIARMNHGPVFDEAFQNWFDQVGDMSRPDPQTYFAIMNSPSPGEAIMEWFGDRRTRSEISSAGGLDGYRAKIEQEILAQYGLAPRPAPTNGGGGDRDRDDQGRFAPRQEVRLPTSLARMGSAGRGTPNLAEDGSDAAIYDSGRPERRSR
jgi:hypothetical protein